jgi:putative methionine-R-sulfoxide reductase with GAF domain
MKILQQDLADKLRNIISTAEDRLDALQAVADTLRDSGEYRWIGLYDVDRAAGKVKNLVWSGPGPPEHPTFPAKRGLTGAAISTRRTINVGNVAADPRYLTAFGSTKSEIIVPVFDLAGKNVAGTIDVESDRLNAFSAEVQALLELCSGVVRPLWFS